ncbi:putative sphingolipid transporter spinster -like 2 [Nicotiana attenuata]|uniref:Sphingolipid transporter spinster -like 2 n=1 Tax=Nicotiana attenuata TaxID=49451 RepID=A0A1J6L6H5_NICAT|nr:putative sphingolipid transporter spinster -like 2 [Nicotiana attenuata]
MVVLDRFSGGNPEGRIFRDELCFTYLGFSEKDWLLLPYHHLDGEAFAWFDWLFRNEQYFDWNHFKEKLKLRFRTRTREAPSGWVLSRSPSMQANGEFYSTSYGYSIVSPFKVMKPKSDLEDGDSQEERMFDGNPTQTIDKNYVSPTATAFVCDAEAETNTTNFLVPFNSREDVAPKEIASPAEVTHPFENVISLHIRSTCLWKFFDKQFMMASGVSDIEKNMVQEIVILSGYPWKGGSEKGFIISLNVLASDVVGITYLPSNYSHSTTRTKLELLEPQVVAVVEISTISYSRDAIGLRVDRGSIEYQSGPSSFEDVYSLHFVMKHGAGEKLFDRTIAQGYSLENDVADNFGQHPTVVPNYFAVVMHKNLKPEKPSLWINSTIYFPCDLVLLDIHKVLDGCWNQLLIGHPRILLPRHRLGLAQFLEESYFFMIILIDKYVYVKVGWLDNGRGILDDKRDTVLESSVPPTTIYSGFHEMLLGAFEFVQSSKPVLALSPADGNPSIRRGAIRRLCFAYVSASNEQIFDYAVTIVVPGMNRAWYSALNSAQEKFVGVCHPVNFTPIEVNITRASLPKPLIQRFLDLKLEETSVNPFRLIGVGLTVWTLAVAGCGLSINFWLIATCRMFVGVGEASFISLAAPFIDDNAPVAQKTAWLGIFYMCIPAGIAVGYVYGGLVGDHLNWRWAFWIEAILMLPFAVLGLFMKPLQLKGFSHTGSKKPLTSPLTAPEEAVSNCNHGLLPSQEDSKDGSKSAPSNLNQLTRFWKDMKVLHLEKVYLVNVLGYIAYNFVIGAYSYWGPKAGYNIYHMKNADMTFGGITIVCGIMGTLAGGLVLDRMNSTISNAFKLLSVATFLGAIFCFAAFCFKNLYVFIALFAIGELLVFATQGPVNYVCLHCVKPSLRPLSMAMSTVSIHIFGDVPSSPLVGVVQDRIDNWRVTALILTSILFIAAGIWFIGIFLHSVDRFDEDSEDEVSDAERANSPPLLEKKSTEPIEVSVES